jgi:hypothetical protein
MTIVAPVAITSALLPLPDPADRSSFSARKLEQLRWANNEYSTGAKALADATYSNALNAQADAVAVAINKLAVDASTALAASYAGATAWVSGTTYAIGDRRYSPANGLVYRRLTVGAGTTDPASDATNWAPVSVNAPAQVITASVTQAISGQCLALTNTTAQAAATNYALASKTQGGANWTYVSITATNNVTMGVDGNVNASKFTEGSGLATRYLILSIPTISNIVPQCLSMYLKSAGRTLVQVLFDDNSGNGINCVFNLATGSPQSLTNAGNGSGVQASMVYMGNGWYDCRIAGTPSTTAGTSMRAVMYLNASSSYTGDGVSGVYIDDVQAEAGLVTTSRITTTTATVTRGAGLVAPQRIVLPTSPAADAWVSVIAANGIYTNVIDPNGQTLMGITGPMVVDNVNIPAIKLQFINGTWRLL